MVLKDNESICCECGTKTDDDLGETKWNEEAEPLCKTCFKKEVIRK